MSESEELGPYDVIHKNVFEQIAGGSMPIKLNGKIVGTGLLRKDGSIEMEIFDEEARRMISGGDVGSMSIDYNSKTIEAIMKNRSRKGIL